MKADTQEPLSGDRAVLPRYCRLGLFLCAKGRSGAAGRAAGPDRAAAGEPRRRPQQTPPGAPAGAPVSLPGNLAPLDAAAPKTRAEALAASPRVKIDTPALSGSLALKGARLDDVSLKAYRETTSPTSPNIVLLVAGGRARRLLRGDGIPAGIGRHACAARRRDAVDGRSRCADPANAGDAHL